MDLDPRQQRSRDALRVAVFALAAEHPIDQVTVTQLAARAEVSRATVYHHTASPAALLVEHLRAELAPLQFRFRARTEATPGSTPDAFADAELGLLRHIEQHAAIYRRALTPHLGGPLRALLVHWVETGLREHLERHPEIAPPTTAGGRDTAAEVPDSEREERLRMHAAYAAHGTVGAIERWLRSGHGDAAWASRTILDSSPNWWLRPVDGG